jgi:hypothetical protein
MKVRIYRQTKSAMQSGKNNIKKWLLVPIEEENIRSLNPLMGWTSADNTQSQLKLFFASKEAAIDYAKSQKFDYEIEEPEISSVKKKSYAANFTG